MSDDELELDSYLETLGGGEDDVSLESEKPQKTQPTIKDFGAGTDSDLESFMDNMEIEEYTGEDLSKPWMRYHEFHLITKVAEVKGLIQACLDHGNCALDLETEGFDNRIEYTEKGEPYTRHKIVGYCIGLKGVGYYIPVRHRWNKFEQSPNVDDVVGTENEIKNLCLASQPEVHPEAAKTDPLGSKEHDGPKVIIKFWHAKFDQEFLYPITGIDWWHPDSFEDGMLASYIIYTDGIHGLKDNAMSMTIQDPNDPEKEYPYEMIKFKDLFPKGSKSKDHKFYLLRPEPKEKSKSGWNCVLYGCSDGICTDLLCDKLVPEATKKKYAGFYRIEKQVIQAVRIMERIRVKIDKSKIVDLLEEAERELRNYEERIIKVAADHGFPNFNPSSSAQLANFLFEDSKGLDIKPKPGKTDQDQYKTDEKTLALYLDKPGAPDVLSWIIKHRQINKVRGTYLENLSKNTDEHDQLRLNFKQTGAATGRFTAPKGDADHGFSGVPIQGIPAKNDPNKPQVAHSLRRMFVARDGYVMAKVDYASQELRIAASVSGEPKWINEYVKELATGIPADLHFLTALAFFPGLKKSDPDFKLKRGAGKCVHPDTLLDTALGLIPIKDLGDFGGHEGFSPAVRGHAVDGNTIAWLYNGGTQDLYHVITSLGIVTCTAAHGFVTSSGDVIAAGDLDPGTDLREPLVVSRTEDSVVFEPSYGPDSFSTLGALLVRARSAGQTPVLSYDGHLVSVTEGSELEPHRVLAVVPAGRGPCLDVEASSSDHLYRANGILTHNTANFALVYGGGVGAVQRATGCDQAEGGRLLKAFHDSVPLFSKWVSKQHRIVKKQRGVRTGFKRFISVPDAEITAKQVMGRNLEIQTRKKERDPRHEIRKMSDREAFKEAKRIQAACERKSTNYPIQGCQKFTSLVQTSEGPRLIGDLASTGEAFDAWVGDQWAPAVARDMGPCELAEISLGDGTLIECDTRHKLLVVGDDGYKWVEYSGLEVGMAVATVIHDPLEMKDPPPLPTIERVDGSNQNFHFPEDLEGMWYWLGRYYGDGSLGQGILRYSFGDHEKSAIEACQGFWAECGLRTRVQTGVHTPAAKESTRHNVIVQSAELYNWLLKLGLQEGKTAHTKRFPERVFSETLNHRKFFILGFMDSDGHKPKLPLKIDGVWERSKKGNPYCLHLCQRPLLVDTKRLLRTVGVESTIRGPYRSGTNKTGADTTSYRLDIQRRMYEVNVLGNEARLPKFADMFAPAFLVNEFLNQGPFKRPSFQGNESAYTLYLRLKNGGKVTVYTLRFLCKLLGVELESPMYGYKRLKSKKALGREEHTYTLSVAHPLHRFESDGVITKNSGADILKISLIFLIKEFHLRGWLKNGGDDSVRLVMTVHDEIVFEIRHDRVAEAIPVLKKIMEYPSTLARWTVPLIAEPELGDSWNAKLDWIVMRKGEDPENHPVPDYLQGKEIIDDPEVIVLSQLKDRKPPPPAASPATVPQETQPEAAPAKEPETVSVEPQEPEEDDVIDLTDEDVNPPKPPPKVPPVPEKASTDHKRFALFQLGTTYLRKSTVASMATAIQLSRHEAYLSEGETVPLELKDFNGKVLIDHKDGVLVFPQELARRFREYNLGPDTYEFFDV